MDLEGIPEYVRREGFVGPALASVITRIIGHWELYLFQTRRKSEIIVLQPFKMSSHIVNDLVDCLVRGRTETALLDEISESRFYVQQISWANVFILHHLVRRYGVPSHAFLTVDLTSDYLNSLNM